MCGGASVKEKNTKNGRITLEKKLCSSKTAKRPHLKNIRKGDVSINLKENHTLSDSKLLGKLREKGVDPASITFQKLNGVTKELIQEILPRPEIRAFRIFNCENIN
eukprot:snap_masked-scaffold_11-processed-gene-5.40-mRNA-1 protein AED:1.00 eAED:1.00 QI:0/0/0/0/1/1/2/0/105